MPRTEIFANNVFLNLSAPYLIRGKNITTDNFFISLNISEALKKKNTTLVGTIEKTSPNKQ